METTNHKLIWITWEHQRRSIVLSKEFGAEYYELISSRKGISRYLTLFFKTMQVLYKKKPTLLFVQNPSMILAFFASIYKIIRRKTVLVVDRHSNFFPISQSALFNLFLSLLSKFTLRKADLTIVTNDYLKKVVERSGGRGIVLEDKIPELPPKNGVHLKGRYNILYICSFDSDEPYEEVYNASKLIDKETFIYVTGNFKKVMFEERFRPIPENFVLLGYLNEDEYFDYVQSVDAVVVLTKWDHTLLCGAYEAVAAEKPLVLSDKKDLTAYFNKGCVTTENTSGSLAFAIRQVIENRENLKEEIRLLKSELIRSWGIKFNTVEGQINSLTAHNKRRT